MEVGSFITAERAIARSFQFVDGRRAGRPAQGQAFELRFKIADQQRYVSVRVNRVGERLLFTFPHICSSEGETLGGDEADRDLAERARRVVLFWEGLAEWLEWRRSV